MLDKKIRKFKQSKVVIFGNGPSLLSTIPKTGIRSCPVIGVNDAAFLGDWIDVMFFGDAKWYDHNEKRIGAFPGSIYTYNRHPENRKVSGFTSRVRVVPGKGGVGIWVEDFRVNFNRSSGACAINLAYHLGAKTIILLGFDMRQIDGRKNWCDRPYESKNTKEMSYCKFLFPFTAIARDAKKLGLIILNATPDSALTHFPSVALKDVL